MRKSLFIIVLFAAPFVHAKFVCPSEEKPKAYGRAQADIKKSIATFANNKPVAAQADALLSKLIAAKSPVITAWLQKRNFGDASEDAIAKAWREYFAQNFILTKYPQGDFSLDAETEKLVDGLLKRNLDAKFRSRLEKLFRQTQDEAVATLESWKLANKTELIARAKAIKLYWPPSLKDARNNAIPLDLVAWGIAYDPVPNEINVGVDALAYPNDETYRAVFAHEMGHAFDSCRWGAFFSGAWPFEKIGACLRTAKSVHARVRDDRPLDQLAAAKKIDSTLASALKQNPTCNKLAYPPAGVQADQLPEAFADWFSAEVMAGEKALNASRLRADLCAKKDLREGSSYPTNADRLFRVYFAQPKLKALAKPDGETGEYCSIE